MSVLMESHVPGVPCRRGKVRDVYDLGDRLVIVATDRISAFDCVLPTGIPDKGRLLTSLTCFWLDFLGTPHHLLSTDPADMGEAFAAQAEVLRGRSMLVRKTRVVPFECVARGYLLGSGWKEYQASGAVCGIDLPPGLKQAQELPAPIFTPTTKAAAGHDQPLTWEELVAHVGGETAEALRARSLALFGLASAHCRARGLLLCDTKFEFGRLPDKSLILVDEALTPDSSRFFQAAGHQPGRQPVPFDKQLVRDWLNAHPGVVEAPEAPVLPPEIVSETSARYREVFRILSGRSLDEAVAEAVR